MKDKVSILLLSGLLCSNVALGNEHTQVAMGKMPTVSINFPDDEENKQLAKNIASVGGYSKLVDTVVETVVKPPHAMAGDVYHNVRISNNTNMYSKYGVFDYYIDIEVKNPKWKPATNEMKKDLERKSGIFYKDLTYTGYEVSKQLDLYVLNHAAKFNLPNFKGVSNIVNLTSECKADGLNNQKFESDIKRELKYIMKRYNAGEVTNINVYLEPPKEHEIKKYLEVCEYKPSY